MQTNVFLYCAPLNIVSKLLVAFPCSQTRTPSPYLVDTTYDYNPPCTLFCSAVKNCMLPNYQRTHVCYSGAIIILIHSATQWATKNFAIQQMAPTQSNKTASLPDLNACSSDISQYLRGKALQTGL